ncbi:MAG: YdcH family protein [Erythrobacter sp.]
MSAHPPQTLYEAFPHDACTLTRLKLTDPDFANLVQRYHALTRSIGRLEGVGLDAGVEFASDAYLAGLRHQRLRLLDEIAVRIEEAEARLAEDTPTPPAVGLFGQGAPAPA